MPENRLVQWRATVFGSIAMLMLAGCDQQPETVGLDVASTDSTKSENQSAHKGTPGAAPVFGEWKLVSIDSTKLRGDTTPTIVFGDQGQCWGTTGVNNFRTEFSIGGVNSLEVGPAAVTRMAGPPEAMAVEKLFLQRLESAVSYEINGDVLSVNSGENQNVSFERIYR